jgi:succinyl-diaminopimelate desuccinylase
MDTEQLQHALDAVAAEAQIRLTADLIQFPSVTPPGGEEPIAVFLAARFRSHGLAVALEEVVPGRCNALGHLSPVGGRPHLVHNGHVDVVPAGDGWSLPPFEPTIREGRVHGRGAADMKGGLAALIGAVEAVKAAEVPLAGTATLAAVADEEGYQSGTRQFVSGFGPADFGIVAEPTDLRPAIALLGDGYLEATTRGRAAHAGVPAAGHNAIADMAAIVAGLEELGASLARRVPHPLLGYPTLSVGTISGGTITPVVPDQCRITILTWHLTASNAA